MNATANSIAFALRDLRKEKGASLDIIAQLCEIDKSTLSKYERGVMNPKLDTLEKWANALGRTITVNLHQALVEADSV
jgi:transcriptional regulator with XRE-family HTH domain